MLYIPHFDIGVEIDCGLYDRSPLAGKRDRTRTELWQVRERHAGEPFTKAIDELPRVETKP